VVYNEDGEASVTADQVIDSAAERETGLVDAMGREIIVRRRPIGFDLRRQ
jgi:hypothetical protein